MDSKFIAEPEDSSANAELVFLQASGFAANGRLEEAKAMLCQGGQLPSTPKALDLLARITVQAGDFARARKLWQTALQLDPAYEPAKKALDSLSSSWFALAAAKRIGFLVFVTIAGCLAFVGVLTLFHLVPTTVSQQQSQAAIRLPSVPTRDATPEQAKPNELASTLTANDSAEALKLLKESLELHASQLDEQINGVQRVQAKILEGQEKITEQVANLSTTNQALFTQQKASFELMEQTRDELRLLSESYANNNQLVTNSTATLPSLSSLNLSLDGISVQPQSGGWSIRFDSALFDRDDHLKIGSKSLIEALAKALVRTQEKIHVQVVGYADNEPPTWPWSKPMNDAKLGQLRADRVKAILARLSLFPSNALSSTNGTSADLPHPGDSRRNRTVVLRISAQF
jgi:tetratricopeptide (TPR) repeat protein